eukprot:scaffold992_cov175-Amphora_coffeaeformis.AAC.17
MRPSVPSSLEEICQKLQENNRSLRTLDLSHPRLDDVSVRLVSESLCENQVVTAVILSCFEIVDDGAHAMGKALMQLRQLTKLQFRDLRNQREINIFFDLLACHGNIEELSLRHTVICSRSVRSVVNFIRCHPTLRELRIVDSQIDEAAQREFFQGVKGHTSLKRVYLINVGISSTNMTYLVEMIEGGSTEELRLCESDIGDEGVVVLAPSMVQSKIVHTTLDLRSNGITHQAALSLQGMLISSPCLSTLNISNNDLSDIGTMALARGLAHSRCVVENLDLSQNDIGSKGILALANTLRTNKSLENLNISFNSIGDEGATAIAATLGYNNTLRCITMRRCGITNQGAQGIADCLPNMHGVKELFLTKNDITTKGSAALLQGLRQNVEIENLHIQDKVFDPIQQEIIHWIQLNKAGRRIFRKSNAVQASLWPYVYARISYNFDMLYHFITEKPDLTHQSVERLLDKKAK